MAAKERLRELLEEANQILVKTEIDKKARGKYGRILGEFKVYNDETDAWVILNDLMIEKYQAVAYHGQSKEDIEEQHLANRGLVDLGD